MLDLYCHTITDLTIPSDPFPLNIDVKSSTCLSLLRTTLRLISSLVVTNAKATHSGLDISDPSHVHIAISRLILCMVSSLDNLGCCNVPSRLVCQVHYTYRNTLGLGADSLTSKSLALIQRQTPLPVVSLGPTFLSRDQRAQTIEHSLARSEHGSLLIYAQGPKACIEHSQLILVVSFSRGRRVLRVLRESFALSIHPQEINIRGRHMLVGSSSCIQQQKHRRNCCMKTKSNFKLRNLREKDSDRIVPRGELIGGLSAVQSELPSEVSLSSGVQVLGCPFQLRLAPPFNFSLAHLQLWIVFQHFVKKLQRVALVYIQTRPPRLSTILSTLNKESSSTLSPYDFASRFILFPKSQVLLLRQPFARSRQQLSKCLPPSFSLLGSEPS